MPERTALPTVPCVFCSLVVDIVDFSWCCIPNMTTGTGWYCWLSQFFNQHLEILIKVSLDAENICSCRRLALRFKIIRSIVIWPNVCGRLGTKKTLATGVVFYADNSSALNDQIKEGTCVERPRLQIFCATFLYQFSLLNHLSSIGESVGWCIRPRLTKQIAILWIHNSANQGPKPIIIYFTPVQCN